MRLRTLIGLLLLVLAAAIALGQSNSSGGKIDTGTTDPCLDPKQAKSSVAINTTASAQLVALSGSTVIYVCGFNYTSTGTSPTTKFVYGTGAACVTGQIPLTGVYAPTAGSVISKTWDGTGFQSAPGNALCLIIAGTTPSIQGVVTYVQK